MFGLGSGHCSRKVAKIAEKHGAELVNHTEPSGEKRHWFRLENASIENELTAEELMDEVALNQPRTKL
jgi:hypothetical protein